MPDCIFCKIASGDIPSNTVYEDSDYKVILDLSPAGRGHSLVIPKKHFDDIYALDSQTAGELFQLTARMAALLKERLGCAGLNVLQNNGKTAGQTVGHIHVHLIPRYEGDAVIFNYQPGSPAPEELKAVLEDLKRE